MKVVLFCGGQGLRIRDYSDKIPKPMIPIGNDPILWHIMKYYAHFGHTHFILCLGYQGISIRNYFEWRAAVDADMADWTITYAETGLTSTTGERLMQVGPLIGDDEHFLLTYGDTLTDAPLDRWIDTFKARGAIGSFMAVRPHLSLHHVVVDPATGLVEAVRGIRDSMRINGGFCVFRREVLDYLRPGEELVEEPFGRLIARRALIGQVYDGFWATMDTYKDRQTLEEMVERGDTPWQVWRDDLIAQTA